MNKILLLIFTMAATGAMAQSRQDTLAITRVSLDYIESQITPNPAQMERALHPLLVKRTFWKDQGTQKEYLYEATAESMILLAERYNKKGDKFPANPRKEVKLLDVSDRTASVKLIANDWIDYMHLVKYNGQWKIVNVLWQFHDSTKHQ